MFSDEMMDDKETLGKMVIYTTLIFNHWVAAASGKYVWLTPINEFMIRLPLSDT